MKTKRNYFMVFAVLLNVQLVFAAGFTTASVVDGTPPAITQLQSETINSTRIAITWQTDEITNSHVSISENGVSNVKVNGDLEYTSAHSMVLTKLKPSTTYVITVKSIDLAQNSTSSTLNISTTSSNQGPNDDFDNDGIINSIDTDDDNDGLPDSYEEAYGMDPFNDADAQMDNDNDSFTNLQEYLAGTDPTNTEDVPAEDSSGINPSIIMYLLN